MMIINKLSSNNTYLFFLIILIFVPKMDLISIGGYHQGIRLEDMILFIYILSFFINYNKTFLVQPYQFKGPFILLIYCIATNFVGYYSDLNIMWAVPIRFIEYMILIIFLNNLSITSQMLKNISIFYIIINLIVAIIQEIGLLGSFTSLGYLPPDHTFNNRALGITGGSWELSILAPLSFFIFLKYETNKFIISAIFLALLIIMILAEGRTNFVALILVCLVIFAKQFSIKKIIKISTILVIILFTMIIFLKNSQFIDNLNTIYRTSDVWYDDIFSIFKRLEDINIYLLYEWIKDFVIYNRAPSLEEASDNLLSFAYRLGYWTQLYTEFKTNIFTQIFGTGMTRVYVESTLIRIWFTTGYAGMILVIFLSRKLPVYQFLFFLIDGFSLDIFMSFKIMLFALLLNKKTDTRYENSN
jgi:hypothetical protein